ncbi:hypothetical protein L0337_30760 [candidate division KSB1 bacterium]|nr:hypothetical protein [candidate division KSB1 bacterium]
MVGAVVLLYLVGIIKKA